MNVINEFLKEPITVNSQIGKFSNYFVKVNSNDPGKIPHVHVLDSNTLGKQFHCCIQLEKNNYFIHDGKTDTLTSRSERKQFYDFMKSKPITIPKEISKYKQYIKNNWLLACFLWNVQNERSRFINLKTTKMPDYTTINLSR